MPDGCVISRLKMLAYYRVHSAFKTAKALPSGMIWHFENNFNHFQFYKLHLTVVLKPVQFFKWVIAGGPICKAGMLSSERRNADVLHRNHTVSRYLG
jgi:hypothetical protein